jgi:putative SOS response-associated peptidase YedK
MCGRYVSVARLKELQEHYEATGSGDGMELAPSHNVAPTNKIYAVVERGQADGAAAQRQVRAVRWGLVPAWWKPGIDPKTSKQKTMPALHNARADKVVAAPSWRGPFAKRRAIIPATGYYEWLPTKDGDGKPFKQPYYIHPAAGLLSFAGLYELWADPAKDEDDPDRWLWSAAIITHHATWLAGVMNDRTPVILPAERIDAWLDPELTDKHAALELITGIEHEPLQVRAVSTAVNKTGRGGSRGPELIEPVGERGDQPLQLAPA